MSQILVDILITTNSNILDNSFDQLELGLGWLPKANQINTKKHEMYIANTKVCAWYANFQICVGGNANFSVFRHVGIGNEKSLCWVCHSGI